MGAASVSLTDEVIGEIREQISQVITNRTKIGKSMKLDLMSGIAIYQEHMKTAGRLQRARRTKSGEDNESERQISGKSFEIFDIHGKEKAYRTDELAGLPEKEKKALFQKYPGLESYAKFNHEQTDVVVLGSSGTFQKIQHKAHKNPTGYYKELEKDIDNDKFVVPSDQYDDIKKDLDRRIKKGGEEGQKAQQIKKRLKKGTITYSQTKHPQRTHLVKVTKDAGNRVSKNVGIGVISDIAVFAFGGAVVEIREAYRDPYALPLFERCKRLIWAIWGKLRKSLKDRALREIGSEIITGLTTALVAPVKRARNAIRRVADVLRRLWMELIGGKMKTLTEVVSNLLKAVFAVASVGIAIVLENWLSSIMAAIPGGDILAAIIAAAVAGVMIVVANRGIEAVVQTLFGIFAKASAARLRREEIQRVCDDLIPQLIEDRDQLEVLMNEHFSERDEIFRRSFEQLQTSRALQDVDAFLGGLVKINAAYGRSLPWHNFQQFDQRMLGDRPIEI